jgi:hypothetical protein
MYINLTTTLELTFPTLSRDLLEKKVITKKAFNYVVITIDSCGERIAAD